MRSATEDLTQFHLSQMVRRPLPRKVLTLVGSPLERLLAIDRVNALYEEMRLAAGEGDFLTEALRHLGVEYEVAPEEVARIPAEGPLVLVANHPFDVVEGMILAHLVRRVRPDIKVLANYMLGLLPATRPYLIPVDPFASRDAKLGNRAPLKEALQWLKQGGALGIFPAGEVAHLHLTKRAVVDPPWSASVGRLVQRAQAVTVPVFLAGSNGAWFQVAGLLHPRMRTLLLPKQMTSRSRRPIRVRIGTPVSVEALADAGEPEDVVRRLRQRTYLLGAGQRVTIPAKRRHLSVVRERAAAPIAEAVAPQALQEEIAALAPERTLLQSGDYQVLFAPAQDLPLTLDEIGRLRELTFRAVGEGTGRARDLDRYDQGYWHLVLWHRTDCAVVGAYRVARMDETLRKEGLHGLYTHSLFDYGEDLVHGLGPALELGRSFVCPEYQRTYAPLMLLWKGIGRILLNEPRYKVFLGAVSISRQYPPAAQALILELLRAHHPAPGLMERITPRNPVRIPSMPEFDAADLVAQAGDIDEVSKLIAEINPALGGVPILLRQYVKLGGRLLGCSVDRAFSDVVDALLTVDLARTDVRVIERFMGKPEAQQFLAYHQLVPAPAGAA
ncbi:MAG TPA: GNAT family N-acyltransferase, partial [bacterium]|nr:GNAT family N-acyltransferase [bacterium]